MRDIKIQGRASGKEKDVLALQGKATVGLCNWAISARMATAAYSSTQNVLPGENQWRFQVHNKDVFISVWTQWLPDQVKICSLPSMKMLNLEHSVASCVSAISRSCFSQANPPFYIMGKMKRQLFSGGLFEIQIQIDFRNLLQTGVPGSSRRQVFCLLANMGWSII